MKKLLPLSSLLSLALLTSCSSALNFTGALDGEVVPAAFSGAMAKTDVQGNSFAFGVWSTLSDTCGLSGLLMDQINTDLDDANETDATIESFFEDVPGDFWLMTVLFTADGRVEGDELSQASGAGFLCHFTDGPDLSDSPRSSCGFIDAASSDAEVTIDDTRGLTIIGELELVQSSSTSGQRVDAGTVEGTATAPVCPTFEDAIGRFFGDCFGNSNVGGDGCQAALNAYSGSHTIQQ